MRKSWRKTDWKNGNLQNKGETKYGCEGTGVFVGGCPSGRYGGFVAPEHCRIDCDFRYVSHDDLLRLRQMVEAIAAENFVPDVTIKLYDMLGFA